MSWDDGDEFREAEEKREAPAALRSKELLCCAEQQLYPIAAELGSLRDKLAAANEPTCAWEIDQTLRALAETVRAIRRAKLNEPLPSLEDVQKIYRDMAAQEPKQHNIHADIPNVKI